MEDSLQPPALGYDSQQSILVVDSQGFSSVPGPGAEREALFKAEQLALVDDARANLERARAALMAADGAVRAAIANQETCARTVTECERLLYDLTQGGTGSS